MLRNPSRYIQTEQNGTSRHDDLARFAVTWITSRREAPIIHETLHILNPERRNNVALVRRETVETSVLSGNPPVVSSTLPVEASNVRVRKIFLRESGF